MINRFVVALSVFVSIFIGSAATAADTITVRARVVNAITGKPIPQMSVYLSAPEWIDPGGIAPTRRDNLTQIGVTNSSGEVEWPRVPRPRRFLILQTAHPNSHRHLSEGRILIDTKSLSYTQRFENNVIKLRPFVSVAGKIVDIDTGKAPPWPTHMSLIASYSKLLRVEGTAVGGGDMTLTVPRPDGSFSMRMAIGSNTLALFGSGICYEIVQSPQSLTVPRQGLRDVTVKVRKKPGFLIRCRPQGNWALRHYQFQIRNREDDARQAFLRNYWFIPAQKWGQTMQVRILHRKSKRVVTAWTRINASPKNWPITIQIGKSVSS